MDTRILIVAGEASGDAHAAKLVAEIRNMESAASFFGAAGPRMRESGVDPIVHSDDLSIVGLPEIAKALPKFFSVYRKLLDSAGERRPTVAILVDFPEFNLKLARSLKKRGIPVVYYISPQLWAWRRYRIRTIKRDVDLLLSILPFEKSWYADHGVHHVEYVGNPLAREVHPSEDKDTFCTKHSIDAERPLVALLPGSRHKEIVRILPELLATAGTMQRKDPSVQFVAALASQRHLEQFRAAVERRTAASLPLKIAAVVGETYNALNAADVAAVTSGTATLEAGIIGTPMAIVYKTSAFNYKLMRPLIDVEHFGLINLITGERVANELIQSDLTAEKLSAELFRLLEPETNRDVRSRLSAAADKLGHGGASKRAAEAIIRFLAQRS
jgi:lipid-A-disaccharide synthase